MNEKNKKEYIKAYCYSILSLQIEDQIKAFKKGFHEIIPKEALVNINESELGFLLAGAQTIDCKN